MWGCCVLFWLCWIFWMCILCLCILLVCFEWCVCVCCFLFDILGWVDILFDVICWWCLWCCWGFIVWVGIWGRLGCVCFFWRCVFEVWMCWWCCCGVVWMLCCNVCCVGWGNNIIRLRARLRLIWFFCGVFVSDLCIGFVWCCVWIMFWWVFCLLLCWCCLGVWWWFWSRRLFRRFSVVGFRIWFVCAEDCVWWKYCWFLMWWCVWGVEMWVLFVLVVVLWFLVLEGWFLVWVAAFDWRRFCLYWLRNLCVFLWCCFWFVCCYWRIVF